jgi:hypothetical protein
VPKPPIGLFGGTKWTSLICLAWLRNVAEQEHGVPATGACCDDAGLDDHGRRRIVPRLPVKPEAQGEFGPSGTCRGLSGRGTRPDVHCGATAACVVTRGMATAQVRAECGSSSRRAQTNDGR